MRVSEQTKQKTRQRIVASARRLFCRKGFAPTTTRDIAAGAGIATGTLFNYFPTKEALGMELLRDALEGKPANFEFSQREKKSIEELLFEFIVNDLHALADYRSFVGPLLESGLTAFASGDGVGEQIKLSRLEAVHEILMTRGPELRLSVVSMHLFWTLYLGVLAFWVNDSSANQENTLAVIDQTTRMFVQSLREVNHHGNEV